MWLGTPCASSSVAQSGGGGPSPLRDKDHIMGLPGVGPKDALKIHDGNGMMKFSASVLEACRRMGVPAVMENPHSSYIWKAPAMTTLAGKTAVNSFVVDMCSFKSPWRKRTRLMAIGLDLSGLPPLCRSCGGKCSYSERPHVELRGKNNGVFLTLNAQAYPPKFCKMIVDVINEVRAKRATGNLQQYFLGVLR